MTRETQWSFYMHLKYLLFHIHLDHVRLLLLFYFCSTSNLREASCQCVNVFVRDWYAMNFALCQYNNTNTILRRDGGQKVKEIR